MLDFADESGTTPALPALALSQHLILAQAHTGKVTSARILDGTAEMGMERIELIDGGQRFLRAVRLLRELLHGTLPSWALPRGTEPFRCGRLQVVHDRRQQPGRGDAEDC